MNTKTRTRRRNRLNAIRLGRPTGKNLLPLAIPGRKIALSIAATCCLLTFNNTTQAQDVEAEWAQYISGPGDVDSRAIALDQDENSYIIANFRDVLNITTTTGTVTLTPDAKRNPSTAPRDLLIAKLDSSGSIIWAKHISGIGDVEGADIKVDHDKNIYVTGFYEDTTDFDPGANKALLGTIFYQIGGSGDGAIQGYYKNSFLLKLDNKGEFKWVRNFYGNANEANGIAIEKDGRNVYITGTFKDTIDVNQQKRTDLLIAQPNRGDVFVAKFDNSGNYLWAKQMGGSKKGDNIANGISVDDKNFVYTTGRFSDSADFDPGSGTAYLISSFPNSPYLTNIFISKLDSNGNYVWAKGMNENKGLSSLGMAITNDSSGNVLITGRFTGTLDFDPAHINSNAILTVARISSFVAKYDDRGNYVWAKAFETSGGRGSAEGDAITTDDAGSVYTTGTFTDNININPGHDPSIILTTTKNQNTFISKLDKDGVYVWGKQFYGANNRGFGIVVSEERKIYINGYFQDTVNFNPVGRPIINGISAGHGDAYVVKLSCIDPSDTQLVVNICADQYELNGKQYDSSGTYRQVLRNMTDCDSIITLELTLNKTIKPVISVQNFLLSTTPAAYKTYQWLLNGNAISGATGSTYEVKQNGDYQVVVSNEEGCIDTSDIYTVTNAGIEGVNTLAGAIKVYPNPATERIIIQSPVKVDVTLTDITGRTIKQVEQAGQINISDLAPGLYLLRMSLRDGTLVKVAKVVKQAD